MPETELGPRPSRHSHSGKWLRRRRATPSPPRPSRCGGTNVNRLRPYRLCPPADVREDIFMSNPQGQLSIRTSGSHDDLVQLLDWFRHDDALRGRVKPRTSQIREGQLGDLYDVLTVAVGAGGLAPALALSLNTWLAHRRSDIKILITSDSDKVSIEIDAKRADPRELTTQIQNLIHRPPPPQ